MTKLTAENHRHACSHPHSVTLAVCVRYIASGLDMNTTLREAEAAGSEQPSLCSGVRQGTLP